MDQLRIMCFLVLLFSTLSALQFSEARVLDNHFHNAALAHHNSAIAFHADLNAEAVVSSTQNYSGPGGHVGNYSESNVGSSSEISTHTTNNMIITVEFLKEEGTSGDGSSTKAPAGIKEVAPVEGNVDIFHEMLNSHSSPGVGHINVDGGVEGNILSSSGKSPGVRHWEKSKTKYSTSPPTTTHNNVLSSGPNPGVGNAHTSAIAHTQSELGIFNKLPSGPSPGDGNAHTSAIAGSQSELGTFNKLPLGPSSGNGNAHTSAIAGTQSDLGTFNKLPSWPSPGNGNAHTNAIAGSQSDLGTFNKLPSGPSPGNGNAHTSANAGSQSELGTFNKLPSGPSPGVGNANTNAIAGTQSELGTFNKLPSGSSPGVGHKVTSGYTEMAQELESKKSTEMMNILPSGPSPGAGNSATNGRNMMEKISKESESRKKTASTRDSESKKKSAIMMNRLPSGPSPGVGNSFPNGRTQMEKMSKEDEEGMGIQAFNRLPSGGSPGTGHSYTNAHEPEKLQRASEDRKSSDDIPIFHKLPGGPSPGGGHSYVRKSVSSVRMQLSSNSVRKTSSSPSHGDGNSSMKNLKAAGSRKEKVESTSEEIDWKIGCDGGGVEFYGTPTPPMFGITTAGS